MRKVVPIAVFIAFLGLAGAEQQLSAPLASPLRQIAAIPLPNVEGRIDHFAVDLSGHRLLMSALGNDTLEVFDLKTNQRLHTITGLHEPQGVLYNPQSNRIFAANGDDGTVEVFDGTSYKLLNTIRFDSDADNLRLDAAGGTVYIGYGEGAIGAIDGAGTRALGKIPLSAHPESFQLERSGPRMFVNVPNAGEIAVLDREKHAVIDHWKFRTHIANFPMALDEGDHRLFVVARRPAELIVFNTQSGRRVAHLSAVGDADDVWYDAARKRIYVSGGDGFISVFEQTDADHYRDLAKISTAPGARTSFFSPDVDRLFVAVPHRGDQRCEVRIFEIQK